MCQIFCVILFMLFEYMTGGDGFALKILDCTKLMLSNPISLTLNQNWPLIYSMLSSGASKLKIVAYSKGNLVNTN